MATASLIQNNFNGGEIGPLVYGRVDIDSYKKGVKTCLNWIPTIQGPVTARPGFDFVAEVKYSAKKTRIIPFQFSTTQAYIIELGDQYIRFYKDKGQILSGMSAYEIVSPYLEADLMDIKYNQSADVIYLTHPNYAPRKLTRTSHTSWTLTTISFYDGPYLKTNTTTTTFTPSATSGSVTITASAATFASTDVGRLIRIKHSTTWGWATITAYTDSTHVTATVGGNFGGTTASVDWRLGVWSGTTGYPAASIFFGDRLYLAGCTTYPQRLDGSVVGDYENFQPTNSSGVVADDNAVSFTLNSSDVDAIRSLSDNRRGLVICTTGSEWVLRSSSLGEAITPTNVFAERSSTSGCANLMPVRTNMTNLFVQAGGEKVREMSYTYEEDGYIATDMTIAADHITRGGLVDICFQKQPQSCLWFARADGYLLGFTYEPEQKVVGWHRHKLGGTNSKVISVASIPSAAGGKYELWVVVERTINGSTKKYIEVMNDIYNDSVDPMYAVVSDSALLYDGSPTTTISGLDHLEGETVEVKVDGATHPDCVVTSGSITLVQAASVVVVGLHYNSDVELLRPEGGSIDGTSQGKLVYSPRYTIRLLDTNGLSIGKDADTLSRISFRDYGDTMGEAVPLYSGDIIYQSEAGYTTDQYLFIRRDQPFPATIQAVIRRNLVVD